MDHTRHLGIYVIPRYFRVGIVGAGGLGAMTALVLAKMGVRNFVIWDDDVVSQENIPTQLHPVSGIGNFKVNELERTLDTYADGLNIEALNWRVEAKEPIGGPFDLFIAAVDSITARQDIWKCINTHSSVRWFLDMRMAAEQYQHFLVDVGVKDVRDRYEEMLFSINEEDIPDAPCTEKATFYCAAAASGHAGTALRNIVREEAAPHRMIHYIPQAEMHKFNI